MKRCLRCDEIAELDWRCLRCGWEPQRRGELLFFAPELIHAPTGYTEETFVEIAKLEARSFWFRARNRLLTWAAHEYFPAATSMLEVGCGTGFVLSGVRAAMPEMALSAGDPFEQALRLARGRVPDATVFQMDARHVPFDSEFDIVGVFDVLEHIAEDDAVLAELYRAAREHGGILITVPQHPWLWGPADVYAHHERRYTRGELVEKVERAGFSILHVSSFVTLPLPLMAMSRAWQRSTRRFDPFAELSLPRAGDVVLGAAMRAELAMIRRGASLRAGGSLFLAASKTPPVAPGT